VAVKLKGADGSFKPIDQKPCFTVNLDMFKGAERFHGMKKFHLNNANEDPSFLRQLICGEIARAGGVPAVRCTHAFVRLNDRDLGLYVFTEGFTKDFLAQFYKDPQRRSLRRGLMQGHRRGLCRRTKADIRFPRHSNNSSQPAAKRMRGALEKAWRDSRPGTVRLVSRDGALLGVGDGYNFFHNNYRLYHDPVSAKLSVHMHGMDQPLG
jgi:hypothetical protein